MNESDEEKLVKQRLSALQLAETLGNVTEACRRKGISRTQFYEYKRRFQRHGLEGLRDRPPIHKSHPQTTPEETVGLILELSLANPNWGCVRISDQLKLNGISVSSPTVQKILIKNDLGSTYQRLLRLEEQSLDQKIELTESQTKAIEKANPCLKERHNESSRPGELLCQETFYVGQFEDIGKVYLQAVIDTYGSYAFGYLHTSKIAKYAAIILDKIVLPQYQKWNIPVSAILTDNGKEYCGSYFHAYEFYLYSSGVEHRKTKVNRRQKNGFVDRFHRILLKEFLRSVHIPDDPGHGFHSIPATHSI